MLLSFLNYLTCNFDDLELGLQGHPMSKVMVSIESPFVVSYLTSIVSSIVSLVVFEISDAEVL